MRGEVLIVDDEADIRELVSGILEDEGYRTRVSSDGDSALQALSERRPNLVLLDVWMQGDQRNGLEVLDLIKRWYPDLPVIMISGHGSIETAVSAIKRGAYDFIEKPFKASRLLLMTERALENVRLHREVSELRKKSGGGFRIVGDSPAIFRLRATIGKVAKTNARLLISGSSGSGKGLVARSVHMLSSRKDGPFVRFSPAAVEPARMDVELFGSDPRKDERSHVGVLELAHGGTLYIDEVADIPLLVQAKLLRVLLDRTFCRVGGQIPVEVDVRILSSSSRDLGNEVREGRLRSDLFHRLNVIPIRVPALAERREDIPLLVDYFIQRISCAEGLPFLEVQPGVMALLQSHEWPGNVRQLRNVVERLMILPGEEQGIDIGADVLRGKLGEILPALPVKFGMEKLMAMPLRGAREAFEREYLGAQMNRFGGNVSRTAAFIGMERSALHRKLRLLGLCTQKRVPG